MSNPHVGSSLESFLRERGILDEVRAMAAKKIAARSQYAVARNHNVYVATCVDFPGLEYSTENRYIALSGIKMLVEHHVLDAMRSQEAAK